MVVIIMAFIGVLAIAKHLSLRFLPGLKTRVSSEVLYDPKDGASVPGLLV